MTGTMRHWILILVGFCCCYNIVRCRFIDAGVKYQIILDVFSGREDPEWEIDGTDVAYSRIAWAVNNDPPTEMDDDLGYRGFIVRATNVFGQMAWKTIGRHTNVDLENDLLGSVPVGSIDEKVKGEVTSGISGMYLLEANANQNYAMNQATQYLYNANTNGNTPNIKVVIHHRNKRQTRRQRGGNRGGNRPGNRPGNRNRVCSVKFEPNVWNVEGVVKRNNCYNYATNRMTNSFAQPGRGSGRKFSDMNSRDVYAATVRDGLTPLNAPDAGTECLIALVVWPGEDFHYYRLDNNGFWSHKSGQTEARDTDDSGNRITDPRRADRGPYSDFSGWLGCGPQLNLR